jgi:hypothetical protein
MQWGPDPDPDFKDIDFNNPDPDEDMSRNPSGSGGGGGVPGGGSGGPPGGGGGAGLPPANPSPSLTDLTRLVNDIRIALGQLATQVTLMATHPGG